MTNEITKKDIAKIISEKTQLPLNQVLDYMHEGCNHLSFNSAVYDFAIYCKQQGIKTVLVTVNMDIFSEIVVPKYELKNLFEVIINSADFECSDKNVLWKIGFDQLVGNINYHNSLLIEDSKKNIKKFRRNGGFVHQYLNDNNFLNWRNQVGL